MTLNEELNQIFKKSADFCKSCHERGFGCCQRLYGGCECLKKGEKKLECLFYICAKLEVQPWFLESAERVRELKRRFQNGNL